MVYERYFPDEQHAAEQHSIKHVKVGHLPVLDEIEGDKPGVLQVSIKLARIIEGKVVEGKARDKVGA